MSSQKTTINANTLLALLLLSGDTENFSKLLAILGNSGPSLSDNHVGITCDSCSASDFSGCRFKCFECKDYDQCLKCFKSGAQNKDHQKNHAMLAFRIPLQPQTNTKLNEMLANKQTFKQYNLVHQDSQCNSCGAEPIVGLKFKCQECPEYQFCYKCYLEQAESDNHSSSHRTIVIMTKMKDFAQDDIQVIDNPNKNGSFGAVLKAKIKSNGKIVALKIINAEKESMNTTYTSYSQSGSMKKQTWENERRCYSQFFSEHIINCYGFWSEKVAGKNTTRLYIILQWMESTLEDEVKNGKQSKRRLFQYMYQVAKGLLEMHQKKFIHKDIKPDNILISNNGEAKLGDLGIAQQVGQNTTLTKICHRNFGAPEAVKGQYFNQKMDMYAYGLTLNFAFTGKVHTRNPERISNIICQQITPYFPQLVISCLNENYSERISSKMMVEYLEAFDKVYWSIINDKITMNTYTQLSNQDKDDLFDAIYKKTWPQILQYFQQKRKQDQEQMEVLLKLTRMLLS